jgi:hypothetical protein
MKLQIRVDPATNTISDVKFKTFGCGSAIASSSYLTELVRGMNIDDAAKIKNTEIAEELCLPPVKCMFYIPLASPPSLLRGPRKVYKIKILTGSNSTLLDARRRRHQIRRCKLLHQEPLCQSLRSSWNSYRRNAQDLRSHGIRAFPFPSKW